MLSQMIASLLVLGATVAVNGSDRAPPQELRSAMDRIVADGLAPGAAAAVYRNGERLYCYQVGTIDCDDPVPMASASKWVAVALILTLVDDGALALDQSIGDYVPVNDQAVAAVTVRQLLSFTSGQGDLRDFVDLAQPPDISLEASAAEVLSMPLQDRPGAVFRYGSGALQIAGAIAERVTGQSWHTLFDERFGRPLRMAASHWTHPLHPLQPPHRVTNPILQAGLVSTAEDYGRFLSMLSNGGSFDGQQVLSEEAVEEMERLHTAGVTMGFTPPGVAKPTIGYALGNWCERHDERGRCQLVSSPGALGSWPWLDREQGIYGVFVTRSRFPRVASQLEAARAAAIEAATE